MNYLIVGLGNPGEAYSNTRHNIGFRIVAYLAQQHQTPFILNKLGHLAQINHRGRHITLLQPTTYMNQSGYAVRYWAQQHSIPYNRLIIITDDLHLPLGHLRLRAHGSSGGHNGLQHIVETLATRDFPRLRCGIGNHFPAGQQAAYVLDNFRPEEQPFLEQMIPRAAEVAQAFTCHPIQRMMHQYNQRMQ